MRTLPTEILWHPVGCVRSEFGLRNGKAIPQEVHQCDAESFAAVLRARAALASRGQKLWIDFGHVGPSLTAAFVTGFRWDAAQGILADLTWTPLGLALLQEKSYRLSPTFASDPSTGRVIGLVASGDVGGLVERSAYGDAAGLAQVETTAAALTRIARELDAMLKGIGAA